MFLFGILSYIRITDQPQLRPTLPKRTVNMLMSSFKWSGRYSAQWWGK
jgi:hypothetical protein